MKWTVIPTGSKHLGWVVGKGNIEAERCTTEAGAHAVAARLNRRDEGQRLLNYIIDELGKESEHDFISDDDAIRRVLRRFIEND